MPKTIEPRAQKPKADKPKPRAATRARKAKPTEPTPPVIAELPPTVTAEFEWPTDLPSDDDVPMESPWHLNQMVLLIESIKAFWNARNDFFVGGNMFLYFSERYRKSEDFRGPDFFLVKGVERHRERESWMTWKEDVQFPDIIVELLSRTTREKDLGEKKDIYERIFKTSEYFCYDPSDRSLVGWRLKDKVYQAIVADGTGRLWSEELDLWLGHWDGKYGDITGKWVRFFTPEGKLVQILAEANATRADQQTARAEEQAARAEEQAARAEEQAARAEEQAARAEEQAARAEEQTARAGEQAARAEEQAARADREAAARTQVEAELARLKEELARRNGKGD